VVVRWLMTKQNKVYKIGIQIIAAEVVPAAIRVISGSLVDSQFRRAFIVDDPSSTDENFIITTKGIYIDDR